MPKYVKHISGQGDTWEIVVEYAHESDWCVCSKTTRGDFHFLPKSEYQECATPERWVECTRENVALYPGSSTIYWTPIDAVKEAGELATLKPGYRWSWKGDALVIEKREP